MPAIPSSEVGQPTDSRSHGALLPGRPVVPMGNPAGAGNGASEDPDRVEIDLSSLPGSTPATPAAAPGVKLDAPATPPAVALDLDTSSPYEYDATGDPSMDYVLAFIGKQGYGPGHPAVQMAQTGNFDLIAAELAQKGVAGAEAVVNLARSVYAKHEKTRSEGEAAVLASAAQIAGSADNWQAVRAWAGTTLTPAQKAQVNEALDKGGLLADGVIQRLVSLYSKTNTLHKVPANAARDNATPGDGGSGANGPITADEFKQATASLRKLAAGRNIDGSDQMIALRARRTAGIRAGL